MEHNTRMSDGYTNVSENIPKIAKDSHKLPRKIRKCFDHTPGSKIALNITSSISGLFSGLEILQNTVVFIQKQQPTILFWHPNSNQALLFETQTHVHKKTNLPAPCYSQVQVRLPVDPRPQSHSEFQAPSSWEREEFPDDSLVHHTVWCTWTTL